MKYAFNTWAYSSYPAYPLDESIRRLAAIEYDGGIDSRFADPNQIARTALKFLKGVEAGLQGS